MYCYTNRQQCRSLCLVSQVLNSYQPQTLVRGRLTSSQRQGAEWVRQDIGKRRREAPFQPLHLSNCMMKWCSPSPLLPHLDDFKKGPYHLLETMRNLLNLCFCAQIARAPRSKAQRRVWRMKKTEEDFFVYLAMMTRDTTLTLVFGSALPNK